MNRRMILHLLARTSLIVGALMVPSVLVGLYYREWSSLWTFFPPMGVLLLFGILFGLKAPSDSRIFARDGFVVVGLCWILLSVFGALPFFLWGKMEFSDFFACLFESASGFTTTGSTILSSPESLPFCLLFWRSFTHWIGGMGVLVFVMMILPMSDDRSVFLMKAEVPGPVKGKLVPKMKKTSFILYAIYTGLTVLLMLLLLPKMPLFDAVCNALGCAGTGGFAVRDAGISFYDSAYVEIVLGIFMLLFAINFNLYYLLLLGRAKDVLKNKELRTFLIIVFVSVGAIAVNTVRCFANFGEALRHAFFNVAAVISTTGFASCDFTAIYPSFSLCLLVTLMFIGGCAGSTAGGLKLSRVMLLIKAGWQEIRHMIHPRSVRTVRLEGAVVGTDLIRGGLVYFALYMLILILSSLLLSIAGEDFTTTVTSVITCLNNIGPGLGEKVGASGNFFFYPWPAKLLLTADMLLGRLEIMPMLVLFSPSIWKKSVQ